jgi:hypothetical protein
MKTKKVTVTIKRGKDTEVLYGQVVGETTTHYHIQGEHFDEFFAKRSKLVSCLTEIERKELEVK